MEETAQDGFLILDLIDILHLRKVKINEIRKTQNSNSIYVRNGVFKQSIHGFLVTRG